LTCSPLGTEHFDESRTGAVLVHRYPHLDRDPELLLQHLDIRTDHPSIHAGIAKKRVPEHHERQRLNTAL